MRLNVMKLIRLGSQVAVFAMAALAFKSSGRQPFGLLRVGKEPNWVIAHFANSKKRRRPGA
jgi:hypothetical protein